MKHLRPAQYRIMPWKNGGGTTTEIAIHPENAQLGGGPFLWRVSIADVAGDGRFSRFQGYDRHIMTIAGSGLTLDAGENGRFEIGEPLQPLRFSGDWAIECHLHGGPSRDFNLIVWRAFADSQLTVLQIAGCRAFTGGSLKIVYIVDGDLTVQGHVAASGDCLVFEAGEMFALDPLGGPVRIGLCELNPRPAV